MVFVIANQCIFRRAVDKQRRTRGHLDGRTGGRQRALLAADAIARCTARPCDTRVRVQQVSINAVNVEWIRPSGIRGDVEGQLGRAVSKVNSDRPYLTMSRAPENRAIGL